MYLIEADAKQILEDHGLPVPPGRRFYPAGAPIGAHPNPVAAKAQVLAGGRGKAGLVRLTDGAGASDAIQGIRESLASLGKAQLVLVEDQIKFTGECYLAWRIDDQTAQPTLMFSKSGGVDIEENPDTIREWRGDALAPVKASGLLRFFADAGLEGRTLGAAARFAADLWRVMQIEDASLIEINPLAITPKGDVIALDCKMTFDENAQARHGEWERLPSFTLQQAGKTPLELRAAEQGFTFVELEGDVALFTGGAGLGMALVDMLGDAGHSAANFVDAPGGSGDAIFGPLTRLVFERAQDPKVKAIILFFTLSATSLKGVVDSILKLLETTSPPKPLIVGLVAAGAAEREMTLAQAQVAFKERGVECVSELVDAIRLVDEVSGKA